ncbi:MAG: Gx transporter family protein [bacterium]
MSSRRIARLSLFLSIALTLGLVENTFPPLPVPGVKLGLANIVNIILFFTDTVTDAFLITFLRIVVISIFVGGLLSVNFYISFGGAVLSIASLYLLYLFFKKDISPISVGAVSAFCHISGQLLTVYLLMNTPEVIRLFPLIGMLGTLTGIFTGSISVYIVKLNL